MNNESKEKLVVGQTLIGEKKLKYKGKERTIQIFYGNFCMPLINNDFIVLNKEEYENMLDDFLSSPKGYAYEIPTPEEMEQACKEVKEREKKYKEKNKKESKENKKVEEKKKIGQDLEALFGFDEPDEEEVIIQSEKAEPVKPKKEVPAQNLVEEPTKKEVAEPVPVVEPIKPVLKEKKTISDEELLEKVKEATKIYQLQEETEKENIRLRNSLDKEKRELLKEKEAHQKTKFIKNKDRDELMDAMLFKTVTILLIVASCIIYILFFISLYKQL